MNKTAKIRDFFSELFENKKLMLGLAKNDFKSKYAGSFFGVFWGFALPLVTILLFWFVFQLGFKSPPVNDFPFILWFIPAFTAWNYFSETLMATSVAYSQLALGRKLICVYYLYLCFICECR